MAIPPQVVGAGLRIADEIIGRKLGGSNGFRFVHGTVEHTSGHVDAIIGTNKNLPMRAFSTAGHAFALVSNSMVRPVIAG